MNNISLIDFLLSHSKIERNFILDFFDIKDNYHIRGHSPFVIDLEIVSIWLDVNNYELKKTLIKSYKKNVDYKLVRGQPLASSKHGGNNKINAYITVDCFKMLCMRSNSKKADLVRKYYIKIEELIDEYKQFIIYAQANEINKLEYELIEDKYPKKKYFYIYSIDELYKIGASKTLKLKFNNINSSHTYNIKPYLIIKTKYADKVEKCVETLLYSNKIKKSKDFYKTSLVNIIHALIDCQELIKHFICVDCNKTISKSKISKHTEKYHNKEKIYKIKNK